MERQLGVTYKTAWRMTKLIREHIAEVDGEAPPGGTGNIATGSELHTDELRSYKKAISVERYTPLTVNHSHDKYVGPNGKTTNSNGNFFGHLKRSLKGTHNNVYPKYLEAYIKEFEYRFNRRTTPEVMLDELLSRFPELGV